MKMIQPLFLLVGVTAFAGAQLFGDAAPAPDATVPPAPTVVAATPPASVAPAAPTPPDASATADDPENKSSELRDLAPSAPRDSAAVQKAEKKEVPEHPQPPEKPGAPERAERRERSVGDEVVTFGNAYLAAGNAADAVVAIFGNSEAHGTVHESVVAILGNCEATENVGEAAVAILGNASTEKDVGENVVAVLGDAHANGHVGGNVVSILGTIDLGPDARIDGNVVSVGGTIHRAPGAVVLGNTSQLAFLAHVPFVGQLGLWFQRTIGHGRLLAFHSQLGGAWGIALAFLFLYLLISLAFGNAVTRCAETFEKRPGMSVLTAFLSFLLAPVLMVPLTFTVVGALAFLVALIVAMLVGKAAFLAWIGRRIGGVPTRARIVLAVLIGGLVMLVLYTLPIVGLLLWCAATSLGFGMAVYTGLTGMRRAPRPPMPPGATPPLAPVSAGVPSGVVAAPLATAAATEIAPVPAAVPTAATSAVGPGEISASGPAMPPAVPLVPLTPPAIPSLAAPPLLPPRRVELPPVSPAVSAVGLPRAGFWIRLAASALDVVLIGILGHVAHVGDYFLLLFTAYCLVMWSLRATTIGGIICGLKIVRLDERPVDWAIAIVRVLGAFLSLCVAGLGFMWVAFDPEMQSWHDKVAGTTIVRVPKGTPLV